MKKIIALCLSLVMAAGIMSVPVMAEKIVVDIPAATPIEQSFAGPLTEVPAGWTLSGTYTFGEKGIRATNYSGFTLYKDEAFDVGEGNYTFSATFAHNGGISYLHIGAVNTGDAVKAGVDGTGYTMKIASKNYNTGVYTIYKNGDEIGGLTDTNTSYGFQGNRKFTFTVTNEGLTVTGAGDTFTYADTEPIKSGYIGIKLVDNNGNKGNLASMSLNTEGYAKEIEGPEDASTAWMTYLEDGTIVSKEKFVYSKTFSAADTNESLAEDGYSITGATGYVNDKGIVRESDGKLEAYFDGAIFSGGYVLEAVAGRSMNNGTVYFNRQDADTYYSVNTKVNNASSSILQIAKVVDGVSTSLLTNEEGAVLDAGSISMPVAYELLNKITLNPQENGDLEITAEFTNSNGTTEAVTVTDKKTETSSPLYYGGFGYANSWSGAASNYIKSFKVYPAGSSGEPEIPEQPVTGAVATYAGPVKTYMDIDLRGVTSLPEGVTATGEYTFGESGPVWADAGKEYTISFGNVEIPEGVSEFTLEASYKACHNNYAKLNFMGYTFEKTNNSHSADRAFELKKGTEVIATGVYPGTEILDRNVPVKVTFKNNKITVSVNGKNVIVDAVDASVSKSGAVSVKTGYIKDFTVGYVNVTSSNVSKTSFLLDKKFSAADTSASLAEDGYSIKGATGYVNDRGIVKESAGTLSVNYTGATFEGAYTFEVVAAKTMNEGRVYFNRADDKNYYIVKTKSGNASQGTLWIQKVADGVATSLLTDENGEVVESTELGMGTNGRFRYTISTEPVNNGDLVINVKVENEAGKLGLFTVTDKKTETNLPFVSGKIGYENSYSGAENNRVESFKVYPTELAENAVYAGEFNVNGEAAAAFVKGNTTFEFPVAMLGQTPDFIAALYEDNKMTAVKVFDVYDINAGAVSLFDTSASTAEEISMAVYVWNDVDELIPVIEEFELK